MKVIISLIVFIFGLWLYFRVRKNQKTDNIFDEIKAFSDNELTNSEKNISSTLFQMCKTINNDLSIYYDNRENFDNAIKEIAIEVFKSAMWRLGDKQIANHFFKNNKYIVVNCDKFINEINIAAQSGVLFYKSSKEIDELILTWVLKFKNDSKANYQFLKTIAK